MYHHRMDALIAKLKALGDENRFRIMMMLRERPLCSCEMLGVLDIAGGTLSAHLRVLRESGLIRQVKNGRWVVCHIIDEPTDKFLDYLAGQVVNPAKFTNDIEVLKTVNKVTC